MPAKDKISVPLILLNFTYKLFVGKLFHDIILRNIPSFDESDLVTCENVFDVRQLSGFVRNHPLKVHKQEAEDLHEIIITSTTIEGVIEIINQMLSPKLVRHFLKPVFEMLRNMLRH